MTRSVVWTADALALVMLAWVIAAMLSNGYVMVEDHKPAKVDGLLECETY